MASLKEYRDERLRKLRDLKKLGFDPYTQIINRTHSHGTVETDYNKLEGHEVTTAGRVTSIRLMGGVSFIDVVDQTGKLQTYMRQEDLVADHASNALGFDDLKLLDIGDFIESTGKVGATKTGQKSIYARQIRLLTKSLRPLPDLRSGLENVDVRYRQRYVDTIVNPEVRVVMETRAKLNSELRRFLEAQGFIEVETPILQPVYGGASARPFTTHHHKLESDYFLRISDELYLKRAIVAGFERVYEIGRDFRNEGIDRTHNPEFTMLEFYWAYATYEDLMDLTEEMLRAVVKATTGGLKVTYGEHEVDFAKPFVRITLRQLILDKTGVDIDTVTREDLVAEIKKRKIDIDLGKNPPMKDLLDEFYKATSRGGIIQPTFLLDYPVEMIPLAKRRVDDPTKVASMQLLAGGMELVKAYNELNDPVDQLQRLGIEQSELDKGTSDEAQPVDYDFVRALEIGMPPTAGWGMGIDRLAMFLTNQETLKDTIMFPTLRPEKFDPKEFLIDK